MNKIIEISHLKKYYGAVKAVDDISFSVGEGEFFAFLGVNGAGKSTTISVLCGKEEKDSGTVLLAGSPMDGSSAAKRMLGVVFQESVLDRSLSVRDNLLFRASLYGITGKPFEQKLKELVGLFELGEILNRPVGKLSGGQRRRADIARALVHDPAVLILDEPTTGLDPQTRRSVWQTVDGLRRVRGLTVFLTTHYMEEAAEADRVVILDRGKILADDTPLALKEKYTHDLITLYHVSEEDVKKLGVPYRAEDDRFLISVENCSAATALIAASPHVFRDYELVKGKMDDVFLAVTGRASQGETV